MCGLSGIANFKQPVALNLYYQAHLRIRHRGLDGEGFFVVQGTDSYFSRGDETPDVFSEQVHVRSIENANVVLGHRRLSILDLSANGHQPMQDASGRYTMVYNGEVYNYLELRVELQHLGYQFRSESDSEVLLVALDAWGVDCFKRFNGMWSLAIYDARERCLILSRDRFGIKPLYYAELNGTIYFASEVKFLLPFLPHIRMNTDHVTDYLVHNWVDHTADTMFADVHQLKPAHYAIWKQQGIQQQSYWELPESQINMTLEEAVDELETLLTSAISLRLRSDVPVGSLLSGGLDSTTIVCLMDQLRGQQDADNSFDFFSAVFHEERYSERSYIEDTIAQTGQPIHWIYPDPNQLIETLPHLLHHQEFPFRSLAVYSQWLIMQAVEKTPITVLLNGQGSDEIFGGYTQHYYALIAEYLRGRQPRTAWQLAQAVAIARHLSLPKTMMIGLYHLGKANPLIAPILKHKPVPYLKRRYRHNEDRVLSQDIFYDGLKRNLTYSALPEYLRYEDRNSMACTLETRLPFLDYRLVEWAMSLPPNLKIEGASSKHVLREMARPLIPQSVSNRTDKMGFISPQEQWQRQGTLKLMLDNIFKQDLEGIFPFLNGRQLQRRYTDYQDGKHNDWAWVWRVACLFAWQQQWQVNHHD